MGRQKKHPNILVQTVPNGYVLKFDGAKQPDGYMYFSPEKLLEGFMLHIGLKMTDQLNPALMTDFIETALKWKDVEKNIKEMQRLEVRAASLQGQRNRLGVKLVAERNNYLGVRSEILMIKETFSALPNVVDFCDKVLKRYHSKRPITLASLDINSDDVILGEPEEEEEDNE